MYGTYADRIEKEASLRALRLKREQVTATSADRDTVSRYLRDVDEEIKTLEAEIRRLPMNLPLTRPGPRDGDSARYSSHRFNSIGEQLACIAASFSPGGETDPRLFEARAASGLSEGVSSDGGFLLEQQYSNELFRRVVEVGKLASRCRKIEIGGNSNSIRLNAFDETSRASTRFGGVVSYWTPEAGEKVASKPKFRQLTLELKKLIGLCYATDEMLQDVGTLGRVIGDAFVDEFAFQTDNMIINGSGAGQGLGILNSGCLVTVGKEVGQVALTILSENVFKMHSRLLDSSETNAVWLVHRSTLPALYTMNIAVGTGGSPVFLPAGGIAGQPYNTLLGRPVLTIEQCAPLGTVGDIILADLSGYCLATKGGLQSDVSIHVRFQYDESVFRFVMRLDGQPERASALTPFKGSATQSHFIALETR